MKHLRGFAAGLVALVLVCGFAPRAGASSARMSPKPGVTVSQVWSRPALAGDTGVVYATLSAAPHAGDRLMRVTSPVAVAVELHESTPIGVLTRHVDYTSNSARDITATPMAGMQMSEVRGVDVPAGGHALLSPGGYHVMLIGLHHALVAGTTFAVTFEFERAGAIVATSTVRA